MAKNYGINPRIINNGKLIEIWFQYQYNKKTMRDHEFII
jgi:hypothetical protein